MSEETRTLEEKISIEFPMQLSVEETEKVLEYLAKELPGIISYKKSQVVTITGAEAPFRDEGTVNIEGTIAALIPYYAFDNFKGKLSQWYLTKISGIQFQPIPGYTLEEHNPQTVKLWDKVRTVVTQYFEKQKSPAQTNHQ